jgi:hypothetical protein
MSCHVNVNVMMIVRMGALPLVRQLHEPLVDELVLTSIRLTKNCQSTASTNAKHAHVSEQLI